MKAIKKTAALLLVFILFAAGCDRRQLLTVTPNVVPGTSQALGEREPLTPGQNPPAISMIFVENTDGADDGVTRLIRSMQSRGLNFHQTRAASSGLIASGDVVILKINAQWDERGGTNTDILRRVIQAILDHPDGFRGEIIVADNGQGQAGPTGSGGSLDWARNNAIDQNQSTLRVINSFQQRGYRVTGVLWDTFTRVRVQEFSAGDMTDGFVKEDTARSTGLAVSYPKFTTEFGTHVSFKEGIWNVASRTYNSEILKVINMPVLKSHRIFQVTGAVKNYMGIPSDQLSRATGRAHNSVGTGGMGTLLVETRMPTLNIMDMIWIAPQGGPRSPYATATEINKIAASLDPVALDHWAARNVLIPAAPATARAAMNPDGTEPGTFGHWLRLSMDELHRAGIWATMDESQMVVVGP